MQMDVISSNKDKNKFTLMIKSTEPYILNAIRRSAVSLVPVMAIEDVEFRSNSSVMYDEMLAHRLGLIPLKTDLKTYETIKNPGDEESLKCTSKLTLSVKGPKTVYSGDLKPSDPAIASVYDNMPVLKLKKGQEVELEATAILGRGKDHAKWSPGMIYYKNKPVINIDNKSLDIEKLKAKNPDDSAITIDGNKAKVDENKIYTTNYFDAFLGEDLIEGIEVGFSEDEYVFNIESFGQLSAKDLLSTSIDMIKEKLDELSSQLNL